MGELTQLKTKQLTTCHLQMWTCVCVGSCWPTANKEPSEGAMKVPKVFMTLKKWVITQIMGSLTHFQRIMETPGGCALAHWRWLLCNTLTRKAHQRAEGCSRSAFPPLEAHCGRPAARFGGHADQGRIAIWGRWCSLANWLPQAGRLLGMATVARL